MKKLEDKATDRDFLARVFEDAKLDDGDDFVDDEDVHDVPEDLGRKLYAIPKRRQPLPWKLLTGVAASLFVGLMVVQQVAAPMYRQYEVTQTEKQLAVALQYLNRANVLAEKSVKDTLDKNLEKAGIKPITVTIESLKSA